MTSVRILCTVLFFRSIYCASQEGPLVYSNAGMIKGLRSPDETYSMFLGIPYASVDKDNPFRASSPHPIFDDVFEANNDSVVCPQLEQYTNEIKGSLDCLQLNIFTPNRTAHSRSLLPVLVFIHGGHFAKGSKNLYRPKYLIKHGIILVTINYRLGPYGFMCLNTPEVPGNQGLKDQNLALKWIQNNIKAFGGDPTQVTLFGQGAGAVSVDLFLINPGELPFDKAILNGGNSLIPQTIVKSNRTKPILLAEYLGYNTSSYKEALRFLAKVETHSLIKATQKLDVTFLPSVEKKFKSVKRFISQHPSVDYQPNVKNMRILILSNDKELLVKYVNRDSKYFQYVDAFKERLRDVFDFGEHLDSKSEMVRNFYIGDPLKVEHNKSRVIDFDSDITYLYPTQRSIKAYKEYGADNVYFYVFAYSGDRNFLKYNARVLDAKGAANSDELGYLFDIPFPFMTKEKPKPSDQAVIDKMSAMWTNFVKYGNPTPKKSSLLPIRWLPVTTGHWHSLSIDYEMHLTSRPFQDRMVFWTKFYRENWKNQRFLAENDEST